MTELLESQRDRDAAIVARRQSGETLRHIAADFGLSPERIRGIVWKHDHQRLRRGAARWRLNWWDVMKVQRWARHHADLFDTPVTITAAQIPSHPTEHD